MQHYFSFIFLLMTPLHFQFGLLYLYLVNRGIFSLCISPCRSSHNSWWFSCLLPCFCCSWLCPCRLPMGSSLMGKSRMKTWIFLRGHSFFLLFWLCSSQTQTTDTLNNSMLRLNYKSNLSIAFFDSLWDLNFKHMTAEVLYRCS